MHFAGSRSRARDKRAGTSDHRGGCPDEVERKGFIRTPPALTPAAPPSLGNNLSGPAGQSFCIGIFRADLSLQLGPAEMQISIEAVEAMRKQGVKIKSK